MTAMTREAATAASTSAFNGGGTAMAAKAAETTLKVRAEVSVRAGADSGGCGDGGGAGGSKGEGKCAADSDGCGESYGDGCGEGGGECVGVGDGGGDGCSVGRSKGKGDGASDSDDVSAAVATATTRCYLSKGGRSEVLSEEKYSSFEYFAPTSLLMIRTIDRLYPQSKGGRLTSIVGLGRPLNRN
jgi:hypothetical protein